MANSIVSVSMLPPLVSARMRFREPFFWVLQTFANQASSMCGMCSRIASLASWPRNQVTGSLTKGSKAEYGPQQT